jgi:nucleoside-diphosphate-sugar epimerase
MSPKRALVTGAGGFVGRAVASGLADLGWKVTGLDRTFDATWQSDGVHRVVADLDREGIPPKVPDVDLVVHAAWVTTDAEVLGITPAEHVALNLRPLLAVLEHGARTRPAAFAFLSSSGVFAPTDATGELTDTHRPTAMSPYAAAKRAGELLTPAALDPRTTVHILRLGYLFGPGETARPSRLGVSLVAGWLAAAREGRPLAVRSDDPPRDWTFAPDLAPALERLAAGPAAGRPIHLGSPHVVRDGALAALIAAQVPGTERVTVPAEGQVKPPMEPSDIPTLHDFPWTDPAAGLQALMAGGVAR